MGQGLEGKRVLVTRASEQSGATVTLLREQGAEAVVMPTIVVAPPADPAPLARAVQDLLAGAYAWVAFTSANGVERTWDAVVAAGAGAGAFAGMRVAVVGPATAEALVRRGVHVEITARELRGEGLAEAMLAAMGTGRGRVLLPRAAKARDVLPDALRAAGCAVDVVTAYETRPASPDALAAVATALASGRVDAVLFTSSSTVEHLCDALGAGGSDLDRARLLLAPLRVASIGPLTSQTARARGVRVDVEPARATIPDLIRALAESYAKPVA
jgi:uroporphyrinogen III methyltransferase/synthase